MKKVLYAGISFILLFTSCKKDEILPEPVANFTVDKNSAFVNETVTFTNLSENASTYEWDFGDEGLSNITNPTHSYTYPGTYTIKLTAIGEGGSNAVNKTVVISYPLPIAAFTMSKATAETGEEIMFSNQSENANTYNWDFGDGSTSSEENPSHAYSEAGHYTIRLTITGDGGTHTISKQIEITVPPFNIVPGERIGDFSLGENLESLFSFIDETYFSHLVVLMNNGKYLHLARFDDTGIGFFLETSSASLYNTDIPYAIYAFEPFEGNTEKGITFGSTMEQVTDAYGSPDEVTSSGTYSYSNTLGISFWTDDNNTYVEDIYISPVSDTKSFIIRNIDERELINTSSTEAQRISKFID